MMEFQDTDIDGPAQDPGGREPAAESTSVAEISTSVSANSPSSSPSGASSSTPSKRFVVIKNEQVSRSDNTTPTDISQPSNSPPTASQSPSIRIASPSPPTLGRNDAPNHIMPVPSERRAVAPNYAPVGFNFFQRIRSTRQVLSNKASEVLIAATPALSKAGHVVRTAANQATGVATTASSSSNARSENPYTTSGLDVGNDFPNDEDAVKLGSFAEKQEQQQQSQHLDEVNPSIVANDQSENDDTWKAESVETDRSDVPPQSTTSETPRAATPTMPVSQKTNNNDGPVASFRGRYAASTPPPPPPAAEKYRGVNTLLHAAFGSQPVMSHQGSSMSNHGSSSAVGRPPVSHTSSANSLSLHVTSPFIATGNSAGTQSQTALILQSSAGPHMQSLLCSLEPYEHVMLLGQGLMGVNLKDCYNGGVYVDVVLPNGNAEKSGVVQVGDIVVKVGEVPVRKLSIKEVPGIIAKQPRPTVIVLTRKHLYPAKDVQRLSPVDAALSTVTEIRNRVKEERERSIASMPFIDSYEPGSDVEHRRTISNVSATSDSHVSSDEGDDDSIGTSPDDDSTGANTADDDRSKDSTAMLSTTSESSFGFSGTTPRRGSHTHAKSVHHSLAAYASRRHIEMSFYAAIKRAHLSDDTFRSTMKRGFRAVCADARCLPFLASHLTKEAMYDSRPAARNASTSQSTPSPTSSVKLMMWLETYSYHELWALAPPQRRVNHALKVAQKFLIPPPALNGDVSTTADSPLFDLRSDIPNEILDRVEKSLQEAKENPSSDGVSREIFAEVQNHIEHMFCGMHFASFIMEENFARMRAYISGSPSYIDVPLEDLWKAVVADHEEAQNYMHYVMVHLFSSDINRGAGLAAALFIRKGFLQTLDATCADKSESIASLLHAYHHLWNVYLSPVGGTLELLPMTKDSSDALINARELMSSISRFALCRDAEEQCLLLRNQELIQSLRILAEELLWEYALSVYPHFKMDRMHDLLFREVAAIEKENEESEDTKKIVPHLAKGCISRLLRTAKLPESISSHRPHRLSDTPAAEAGESFSASNEQCDNYSAEFAVVFGSDLESVGARPSWDPIIRRFCAMQVGPLQPPKASASSFIPPQVKSVEELPATLEGYAAIDPGRFMKRPMGSSHRVCISDDGWEVYLVNFTVPYTSADHPNNCVYGVSLVLHRSSPPEPAACDDSATESPSVLGKSDNHENMFQAIAVEGAERYLTFDIVHKVDQIFREAPSPAARRLRQEPWSKQFCEGGSTVGVALVANHNSIPAMRQSLSEFFSAMSSSGENNKGALVAVSGLADLLGGFSRSGKSGKFVDLSTLLRPYLESGSQTWEDRPLCDQAMFFAEHSVGQLLCCLSPSAFWLAFLTVLLEQKIVFISSRRSILLSAVTALSKLLAPLEWSHLMVPLVPTNLAGDLIHYPAPFLIGLCSQEKENQAVLNHLPNDVTLIDLDLGRVILGTDYASSNDSKAASTELRLQVFYLAEELGAYLGSKIAPAIWRCEDPFGLVKDQQDDNIPQKINVYETVRGMCREFIAELTAGTNSSCSWIEEYTCDSDTKQELVVLFDEDRFLHLKNLRSRNLYAPLLKNGEGSSGAVDGSLGPVGKFALGLDDFDLILETFLRGQAMSAFISSRPKEVMTYW